MKLIDKSALVAEIDRRKEKYITERLKAETINGKNILGARIAMLEEVLVLINTLEVKEVDFGTKVCKYIDKHFNVYDDGNQTLQTKNKKSLIGRVDVENIAKYFFELGLKAQKGEEV